jgi:hypothetical protein
MGGGDAGGIQQAVDRQGEVARRHGDVAHQTGQHGVRCCCDEGIRTVVSVAVEAHGMLCLLF